MNTNYTHSQLAKRLEATEENTLGLCSHLRPPPQVLWFLRYPALHVARARPQEHLLPAPPVHSKAN